jgi:hypothetical protein
MSTTDTTDEATQQDPFAGRRRHGGGATSIP